MIWKLEKLGASSGVWNVRICIAFIASYSAWSPRPARSSICSLKPPIVPMPFTGGGGNTAMNASWIPPSCWLIAPAIAPPESSGERRFSNASRPKNTMPALGAFVKPAIDRPGNATASLTPGVFRAMSDMRRSTSSVRSSEAPSGSCANPTRYCLSWPGTKPDGTTWKPTYVTPSSTT